ncbi:CinA family protein [[Acholeplasma] multilocale]|uniref:CinA family protein n=1 Tax=[Acholeplasma] multilocale TaxID=264638 RepID=UPI00054E318D|nr:CinA family protein [[Acholeplasma] multilocale]
MDKKITKLFKKLEARHLTMSACESFTGGAFSNAITNVSGASKVFKGSFISYQNNFKTKVVKVNKRVIKKYGVVSQQCAEEMVIKTNKKLKTHVCVSFTGNAGPSGLEDKPAGVGYISIWFLGLIESYEINQPTLNREEFKNFAVEFAINKLNKMVN